MEDLELNPALQADASQANLSGEAGSEGVPSAGIAPPAAAPVAPAAPVIDPARYEALQKDHGDLQQRFARMESDRQVLEMGQSLDRETAEAQQRYEALGLPTETAQSLAMEKRQDRESFMGLRARATQALQALDANLQTGVDVLVRQGVLDNNTAQVVRKVIEASFKHRDPMAAKQAMENDFGKDAKIRTLEARLAKLEKAQVPGGQTFENGPGSGNANPTMEALYNRDTRRMTPTQLADYKRQLDTAIKMGR